MQDSLVREISLIFPCEEERLSLFRKTLQRYKQLGNLDDTEFLVPTRTISSKEKIGIDGLVITVIPYSWGGCFNPSMALNLGVKAAKFNNIIISSPEVIPISDVISEFRKLERGNYVCQVFDEDCNGRRTISLVSKRFRGNDPGMYFLALYRKEDILAINGWDEDFMGGCAWEDNDFGERFVRSGAKFEIMEEIQAQHQYHFRLYTYLQRNKEIYERNKSAGIIKCRNGIIKL